MCRLYGFLATEPTKLECSLVSAQEAEKGGLEALRCAADRLAGSAALRTGDTERATRLLRSAREGYAQPEARWDQARADLSLAEAWQGSGRGEEALILLDSAISFLGEAGAATDHETAQQLATRIADPS